MIAPRWGRRRLARWIAWYGHGREGQPDIKKGSGSVEDVVSHHADVHTALGRHQAIIAARARAELSMYRKTGSMSIGTKGPPSTKLDRYVYLTDANEGNWWNSAVGFEFGHMAKIPKTGKEVWVPGKWIIHKAAGLPHN